MFSGLTGDEQQLDNVLMHVDEEMRLLEEMAETERYFERLINDFENDGIDREIDMIKGAEDKQMKEESMEKENVQQTDVSGVQLKTNGKKEIEKLWKMKLYENMDSKKEKLTTGICISKNRGQQQIKIWKSRGTEVTVAEELSQQHNENDDQLQSKVWDTGWIAEETHDQEGGHGNFQL